LILIIAVQSLAALKSKQGDRLQRFLAKVVLITGAAVYRSRSPNVSAEGAGLMLVDRNEGDVSQWTLLMNCPPAQKVQTHGGCG